MTSEEGLCANNEDDDKDGATDCEDSDCSSDPACKEPEPKDLCHNIGGPDDLGGGANCDPQTGECTITDEETGRTFTIGVDDYFGIIISAGDNAFNAHIKHGDGEVDVIIDPPLHLSSQDQNHLGANVECIADRVNEQDPEPGN